MRHNSEQDLDKDVKAFIPGKYIKLIEPESPALPYVMKQWQELIHKMKEGLKYWLEAIGESEAAKADFDIWYRGVRATKVEYCLTPKAQRRQYQQDKKSPFFLTIEHERTIFLDFERLSVGMHKSQTPSFWSTYFRMQHHEMHTRLLDWTEAFLVALYFAVKKSERNEEYASVLVLFPQILNYLKTSKPAGSLGASADYQNYDNKQLTNPNTFRFTVDSGLDWDRREDGKHPLDDYQISKGDPNAYPALPAALWPSYQDIRMRAQRSVFTIHGRCGGIKAAIEWGKGNKHAYGLELPLLGQIRIEKKDKDFIDKLMNQIIDSGISESTLFPDMEHLSKEIDYDFSPQGRKGKIPEWRKY
jgi:hypothetical protein